MYSRKDIKIIETCNGKPQNESYQFIVDQNGKPIDVLENGIPLLGTVEKKEKWQR